jgi:hypothetical protein
LGGSGQTRILGVTRHGCAVARCTQDVLWGSVHHLRGWDGVTRHAVGTLRGCATSVGMLLRPGGHDVLAPRRGVWVPHGDSAGGVVHEEPVVAPMSPSMRSASLNASRIISRCSSAAPWWEGPAALGAHAGGRRSGLASLERDPAGRDREDTGY